MGKNKYKKLNEEQRKQKEKKQQTGFKNDIVDFDDKYKDDSEAKA